MIRWWLSWKRTIVGPPSTGLKSTICSTGISTRRKWLPNYQITRCYLGAQKGQAPLRALSQGVWHFEYVRIGGHNLWLPNLELCFWQLKHVTRCLTLWVLLRSQFATTKNLSMIRTLPYAFTRKHTKAHGVRSAVRTILIIHLQPCNFATCKKISLDDYGWIGMS